MDSDEKRAKERARRNERRKARRAARIAAGLCKECGKPADHPKRENYCRTCGEKARQYGIASEQRQKAQRAAEGRSLLPPTDVRCPDCSGVCVRVGQDKSGNKRYRCKECMRVNSGRGTLRERLRGDTYRLSLHLDQRAAWALEAYCLKYGVSQSVALRQIFRAAAVDPARPMCVGIHTTLENGKRLTRTIHPKPDKPEPITGPFRFRDLRSETSRAFLSQTGYARYRPPILIVRKVSVVLDGLAVAGIVKIARAYNYTHQQAARFILERTWNSLGRPMW